MIPVGPWYIERPSPKRDTRSGSAEEPVTGMGRVCGVAAGRATSVHTNEGEQPAITSLKRSLKVLQRRFGSTPLTTTRSWSAEGIRA